jgi:glycosyltransferase involved in cell wall biosynthesis
VSGRRPKVAMVVQRCGLEVNGGAELACLDVAREMSSTWDVDIITTCALDYQTWDNYYEPGESAIGDVRILRFPVDKSRSRFFQALSAAALRRGTAQTPRELHEWMKAQGPDSSRLLRYIKENRKDYDVWFFFTYLYATTYFGLPLAGDRAVLVPFAHDEWPIHLPGWNAFFRLPRRIVFSTEEERDFLLARFADCRLQGEVVGIGIQPPAVVREDHFRHRFGVLGSYALYVGRIDPAKGCDVLLRDFAYGRDRDLNLLMLGREAMKVPEHTWLRLLGFVDEQTKYEAMRGAEFIVAPSALESLSLVLLEAWSQERPVLVNAASDVLVGQCKRSNGGLWYSDAYEFAAAVPLLRDKETARGLGANGKRYLDENYSWSRIHAAYEHVYDEVVALGRNANR